MRLAVLALCLVIAAVVFVAMFAAVARHQARAGGTVSEYLWTMVPWALIAAGALPAVRLAIVHH